MYMICTCLLSASRFPDKAHRLEHVLSLLSQVGTIASLEKLELPPLALRPYRKRRVFGICRWNIRMTFFLNKGLELMVLVEPVHFVRFPDKAKPIEHGFTLIRQSRMLAALL